MTYLDSEDDPSVSRRDHQEQSITDHEVSIMRIRRRLFQRRLEILRNEGLVHCLIRSHVSHLSIDIVCLKSLQEI